MASADLARRCPAPLVVLLDHVAEASGMMVARYRLPSGGSVSLAAVVLGRDGSATLVVVVRTRGRVASAGVRAWGLVLDSTIVRLVVSGRGGCAEGNLAPVCVDGVLAFAVARLGTSSGAVLLLVMLRRGLRWLLILVLLLLLLLLLIIAAGARVVGRRRRRGYVRSARGALGVLGRLLVVSGRFGLAAARSPRLTGAPVSAGHALRHGDDLNAPDDGGQPALQRQGTIPLLLLAAAELLPCAPGLLLGDEQLLPHLGQLLLSLRVELLVLDCVSDGVGAPALLLV